MKLNNLAEWIGTFFATYTQCNKTYYCTLETMHTEFQLRDCLPWPQFSRAPLGVPSQMPLQYFKKQIMIMTTSLHIIHNHCATFHSTPNVSQLRRRQ